VPLGLLRLERFFMTSRSCRLGFNGVSVLVALVFLMIGFAAIPAECADAAAYSVMNCSNGYWSNLSAGQAAQNGLDCPALVASQDLVDSFDFENYPAVKGFAAAAKRDPGCVDIT
jgi:hypothetical protein